MLHFCSAYRGNCPDDTTLRLICEALGGLFACLPELKRLEVGYSIACSILRRVSVPSPSQLQYIDVKVHHSLVDVLLSEIARLAAQKDIVFRPFLFRCRLPPMRESEQDWTHRKRAGQDAITAMKDHRGIEVPDVVARSWLRCECQMY